MIKDIDQPEVTYTPKEAAKVILKSIIRLGYLGDEVDNRFICSSQDKETLYFEIRKISKELIEKFLKGNEQCQR